MFRKPSEISSSSEDEVDPSSHPPSSSPNHSRQPTAGTPEQELEPVNPVTLYSPIPPTTSDNHHNAILLNSLLEHFVKSRIPASQPELADRMFVNLAHRLGSLGFVPQTSGDIAREDLAPVRQSYLRGLDHLLSQEIDKNAEENRAAKVLTGDLGRMRGVESSIGAKTKPPFRRLLTDFTTTQDLNPNDRQAIHRSSSLSVLSDAHKNSLYRPSTAPGAAAGTVASPFLTQNVQASPTIIQPAILLPPPRYVNDFVEIALLGKGGYGSVYHVRHRLDGVEYAVKKVVIKKGLLENELGGKKDGLERVMNEIKTLAQLNHVGVVRYFCSWVEGIVEDMLTTPQFIKDHLGVQDLQGHQSPKAEVLNEFEDSDADIVFAYSGDDERIETVETTTTSGADDQTSGDLEDSIESIPRSYPKRRHSQSNMQHAKPKVAFDIPSQSDSESEFTGSNIFSSGGGALIKSTANSHGRKSSSASSGLTLYIQMSLHSFTLTSFISASVHHSKPIPRHCFCVKSSLDIFLSLLDGVQYLHSQGIAHRDLKPGNIFLDIEPSKKGCHCGEAAVRPHIGDFGLGTSIGKDGHDSTASVGTEFYKPVDLDPAIQGDVVGRDLFALGVILLELLVRFGTRKSIL
ncbi:kinase-like protein [Choiromyces venosus 120613-1]|uniref:non-specific serine/threonine protein kinase n=1 Tax=Choiromyces venosus 120613-1 TaxID=1336337 RepID=A0A3N4K630_9PEZI|nr:kinase-like protein [Choiromyces venosus 120613-1]